MSMINENNNNDIKQNVHASLHTVYSFTTFLCRL